MSSHLDKLIARWARIGAGFNAKPARGPVDLERLLLDTARHAPEDARLFTMAATWLSRYGGLIAKHRLKHLALTDLEHEHRPALGLLLDTARLGSRDLSFGAILKHLPPASEPAALFHIEQRSARLRQRAARCASPLAQAWGLWCEPIELKPDALRSMQWVMQRNPEFAIRADYRGDMRSSVVAALMFDQGAGESESALARTIGASRSQVLRALDHLELTGRIRRITGQHKVQLELAPPLRPAA